MSNVYVAESKSREEVGSAHPAGLSQNLFEIQHATFLAEWLVQNMVVVNKC